MKEVTIQDIAAVAKVSKSTVSRVLNNSATVHPDKRKAVLEASERLGFKPNVVARSLARGGRSMTIGVQTQCFGSPFYDTISQGVLTGLNQTNYSPLFVDGQWERDTEVQAIRTLLGRRVDGLVLIGGDVPANELTRLCGDTPTVIVARNVRDHCGIYVDNVDGGFQATNHLIEHGHREIAIIQGIAHHPDAVDRFQGYKQALAAQDIALDQDLVLDGDFSAESGVAAVEGLIRRKKEFTAIFAVNDMMAFGARLALYRHGLRVPADVSIVGFDDQAEAAYTTPPLTTMRQPAREMGEQASRAVLKLIKGETPEMKTLKVTLQIRESVASQPK